MSTTVSHTQSLLEQAIGPQTTGFAFRHTLESRIRRLVAVDKGGYLAGIVTQNTCCTP